MSLGLIGTIASIIVGGVVGAVTIVGVVSSSVNSDPAHPASVADTSIQYGSTGS